MNRLQEIPAAATLPKARLKSAGLGISVAWALPLLAAIVAGYVAYDRARDLGPRITITFSDSSGVKTGQTPLKYRGVQIGEVTDVALTRDNKHAEVKVRLDRSAASVAKDGSLFWIVRPELGFDNIAGLGTVISGPEIQVSPGTGRTISEFTGLDRPPVATESGGLKIVLRTTRAGSLRKKSPVSYRGVEVGVIQEIQLSADATTAEIQVLIRQRYASLVRDRSVFWNVSGAHISAGLFKGMELRLESLRTLAIGGIAFATPDAKGATRAKDGAVFPLYPQPATEWLAWTPRIPLAREQ